MPERLSDRTSRNPRPRNANGRDGHRPLTISEGQVADPLQALSDRADRARSQAIAHCDHLARTLQSCPRAGTGTTAPGEMDQRIRQLDETVEGLKKRLETQPPIEQAKGIIMAQTHCSPDEAFQILRRASQRSNVKLRSLAVDLVARVSGNEPVSQGGPTQGPPGGPPCPGPAA